MLALVIALAGAMLVLFYGATDVPQQAAAQVKAQANTVAANLLSYRLSVIQYLNQNPGFAGTSIPDSSLTFQYGFQRNPAWSNYINAHAPYIYSTMAASGIPVSAGSTAKMVNAAPVVAALYSMTKNNPAIGVYVNGVISNPGLPNGFTVPPTVASALPAGSLVMAGY